MWNTSFHPSTLQLKLYIQVSPGFINLTNSCRMQSLRILAIETYYVYFASHIKSLMYSTQQIIWVIATKTTVGCRDNLVRYLIILHTALQLPKRT